MADEGALALTTNRVAEIAGVSVGSLYQYFPTKEAIVVSLVKFQLDRDQEILHAAIEHHRFDPLSVQLDAILQRMCDHQFALSSMLKELLPLLPRLQSEDLVHRAFQAMSMSLADLIRTQPNALRVELHDEERFQTVMFIMTHALRGALNTASQHSSERLSCPLFRSEICRMVKSSLLLYFHE